MTGVLTRAKTCAVLGVDIWGLATLMRRGEIESNPDGFFDASEVDSLADMLKSRRREALKTLAKLDGPYLG